ncbi:MAG: sulfatase-like hydrolase/transferase [Acholeplasma sp.]|nr:sulfatase-like hydrolase/transferase [Acholeplasma sp.]
MTPIQLISLIFTTFLITNTLNTYFLTTRKLNRYIAPFKHTISGELNALLGNVGTLLLFLTFGILVFRNMYTITIYLIILSFVFNIIFFALSIYNLYYGNAFSKGGLEIFKNPAEGISKGLFREIFLELFAYYRILLFIPTIALLVLFVNVDSASLLNINVGFRVRTYTIYIVITLLLLTISFIIYRHRYLNELPIKSVKTTYAIQNYGVYPYYISILLFPNFESKTEELLHIETSEKLFTKIQLYNKNQTEYFNVFDQQFHSNLLTLNDINDDIKIDHSLIKEKKILNGIFKDKNLILVQVESFNQFITEINNTKHEFPFLNTLLEHSLVFDNFYTSVGIGVSSDAEIATLTGLFPSGYDNYYWKNFNSFTKSYRKIVNLTTLPKYFNQSGYHTKAIHGDQSKFYNRINAYKELIHFNDFYSLESFDNLIIDRKISFGHLYRFEYLPGKFHISPWSSDYQLFEKTNEMLAKETSKYMYFPITMMPHTPFEYHPYKTSYPKSELKPLTSKYLEFAGYYDDIFKRFLLDINDNDTVSNNIYLFYGDHGSGLKNGDLFSLYNVNKKDDPLFERQMLQKLMAFLYVPSEEKITGKYPINKGLITGHQPLVRGQIDIYRTIIDLFGLDVNKDLFFGTNLLSKEKTFALDNKLLDVATDEAFFSLRNPKLTRPSNIIIKPEQLKAIKETKLFHDLLFEKEGFQVTINQELNKKTGNE